MIVDLGCGPGRYLGQLARPVLAVDVSRSMLSLAARYGRPRAQADLESLSFAECAEGVPGDLARGGARDEKQVSAQTGKRRFGLDCSRRPQDGLPVVRVAPAVGQLREPQG